MAKYINRCEKCKAVIDPADTYFISYGTDNRGEVTSKLCMKCLADYDKCISAYTEMWLKSYIGDIDFPNTHH